MFPKEVSLWEDMEWDDMKEDIKLEKNKEEKPKCCLDLLQLFQADIWNWWNPFEDHEIKNNPGSSSFWDGIFCCLSLACF